MLSLGNGYHGPATTSTPVLSVSTATLFAHFRRPCSPSSSISCRKTSPRKYTRPYLRACIRVALMNTPSMGTLFRVAGKPFGSEVSNGAESWVLIRRCVKSSLKKCCVSGLMTAKSTGCENQMDILGVK